MEEDAHITISSLAVERMIVLEFSVVPLGTGNTSLSAYVKRACEVVIESGLRYSVTPMGTVIEAEDLGAALAVVRKAHEAVIASGAKRVSTSIKIDDRRDKERHMEDKVRTLGI